MKETKMKRDGKMDEKIFFLKLSEVLSRKNYIKETEKMQLQKLIRQKWK